MPLLRGLHFHHLWHLSYVLLSCHWQQLLNRLRVYIRVGYAKLQQLRMRCLNREPHPAVSPPGRALEGSFRWPGREGTRGRLERQFLLSH